MKYFTLIILIFISCTVHAQNTKDWYPLFGSAYFDNKSYPVLRRLCDEAGGRLVGSSINEKAMRILREELTKIGYEVRSEKFKIPGWVRANDEVAMILPTPRILRSTALGYVDKTPEIISSLVFAQHGFEEDYKSFDAKNKIILVTSEPSADKKEILRYEAIDIAAKHGAKAILFINEHQGTTILAGVSNFQGHSSPIPAFSITFEEGKWLQRLVEQKIEVTMRINTNSFCKEIESVNQIVTLPGIVKDKIVIGAHFDSWDVSQGAVDNGIGTAILFDVARLMKNFSSHNYYSVEFVWFNGEELGLWGSKRYYDMHKDEIIKAMINMDMTGTPTGFNAMGTDELLPFLENLVAKFNGFDLKDGVGNSTSTNSDHEVFMLHGIPTISLQAHLEPDMYKFYHDLGDTFDKVSKKYLSDAAAIVSILTKELANNRDLKLKRRSDTETIQLLKKDKLDERLKRQKEWIFVEE